MAYVCTCYAYDDMAVPRESHGLMKKICQKSRVTFILSFSDINIG